MKAIAKAVARAATILPLPLALLGACEKNDVPAVNPHADAGQAERTGSVDDTEKQDFRLMPAETYLRSYAALFDASPDEIAALAAADGAGVAGFGGWQDTLATLGLPDPSRDLPRVPKTNTVLLATYDKLGAALCDRTAQADAKVPTVSARKLFRFDLGTDGRAAFDAGFEALHRRFLSYPVKLAPAGRADRYFALWKDVRARAVMGKTADERKRAGWIAVCYGLVRHPEFQLY